MKYINPILLDNGLSHAKANASRWVLYKGAATDYATVTANIVAAAATTSTDYTLANFGTTGRKLTTPQKVITATASTVAGDDLNFAVLDDTNTVVLAVFSETTDQVVTSGNTVTLPALDLTLDIVP